MKKFILSLSFVVTILLGVGESYAQGNAIVPDTNTIFTTDAVLDQTNLSDFTEVVDPINPNTNTTNRGALFMRNIFTAVIRFIEKFIVPIGIIYLVWAGIILIINRNDEETFKHKVQEVIWMGVGFGLIISSFTLVDKIFFGTQGEIFHENSSTNFALIGRMEIQGVVNFVTTFGVAVAVIFLVMGAIQLIIRGENEEQGSKAKRTIIYSILGITVLFMMQSIVNFFFQFDSQGRAEGLDLLNINIEITKWANVLLSFIAFFAVLALIWAGVQMITHFGDEEKVNKSKSIIQYVIIGLILAFSAWALVRYFLLPETIV